MLLSSVLKEMNYKGLYEVANEKEFKYLALTASQVDFANCIFLDNEKYIDSINSAVTLVLTTFELADKFKNKEFGICVVENPRELFFELHNYLSDKEHYRREQFATKIGEYCTISPMASIAKNNVVIGNNVTIEEFVVIRENTNIRDNAIIRAGSKIGGLGFEFKRKNDLVLCVNHLGGVIIGEHVEIQYNTCVDRAVYPWDDTIIGDYCKVDNLVHIAHAVKLGKGVMVVANCGIGGRTVIKNGAWIGFGATVINGITVGENSRSNIGAVVTKSIPDGGSVTGNFAIEHNKFLQNLKAINAEIPREEEGKRLK